MRSEIRRLFAVMITASMILSVSFSTGWLTETALAAEIGPADAEKYDPRTEYTSAVRDQGWGVCWAMSGISSAESAVIKAGMEGPGSELFSVEDVLWWARGGDLGGWVMRSREDGGYPPITTGYLQTVGVRSAKDIPYYVKPDEDDWDDHDSEIFGEGKNKKPRNYDTAPVLYQITDLVFVKDPTPQKVKELIAKYGAVAVSYHDSREGLNHDTGAYWYPYREGTTMNHSVSVIGWDDHYAKENFRCELKTMKTDENGNPLMDEEEEFLYDSEIVTPEHDGAWILKNSYGTDYALDGFNYVSYDDGYLFTTDIDLMYVYCVAGVRKPLNQKRYMHDQFGAVSSWEMESGTSVWANVFNFGSEEKISELSFVTWSEGGTYRMYYAPMKGKVPNSKKSTWILLSEGVIDHAGYTTVPSTWDDNVPKGKGAIILSVTGDSPSIGTDEPLTERSRTLFNPIQDKGTAFVLGDSGFHTAEVHRTSDSGNKYITDVDLCIRAYTVSTAPKKTSLTSLKGVSKGFKARWKKVSGATGYQIQYCTKKSFSSGAKIITIRKNSTVSKTVKKLKTGKKYYVRIRTYKKEDGKTHFSNWSGKKMVRIL